MKIHCSTDGLRNAEGKHQQPNCACISAWQRFANWIRSLFSKRTGLWLLATALLLTASFTTLSAQNSDPLAISLSARKVIRSGDGQETFATAETAKPGEVLQYTAIYRNRGAQPLRDLAPVLPIPAWMRFVADSAKPAPAQASLDGRTFAAFPIKRQIKLASGSVQEQIVPASEYRALRWSIGQLSPNQSVAVQARVEIAPTAVITAKN